MTQRICLILNIQFVFIFLLQAQKTDNKGYYVKLDGDTISTEISPKIDSESFRSISVSQNGKTLKLHCSDIAGYGFGNTHFRSIMTDTSFALLLVEGPLTLLESSESKSYYLQKANERVFINSVPSQVISGNTISTQKDNRWIGVLNYLTADCSIEQTPSLSRNKIMKYVSAYNNCKEKGNTYIKKTEESKFYMGLYVAYSTTVINFNKRIAPVPVPYKVEEFTAQSPVLGLSTEYHIFSKRKYSYFVRSGIQYSTMDFSKTKSNTIPDRTEIERFDLEVTTFSLPLVFGLNVPAGIGKVNIGAGYRFNFQTNPKIEYESIVVANGLEIITVRKEDMSIAKFSGTIDLNLGYQVLFKNYLIQVQYEYSVANPQDLFEPYDTAEKAIPVNIKSSRISLLISRHMNKK